MYRYVLTALLAALISAAEGFDHDEAFNSWDQNRDGTITKEEYAQALRESDPTWGEENVKMATENMFDGSVDTDRDGEITLQEWKDNIEPASDHSEL